MSDLMLMGVLRAPTPEPDNVLGIAQLADRARQAADEIEILIEYKKVSDSEAALAEAEIERLEDALSTAIAAKDRAEQQARKEHLRVYAEGLAKVANIVEREEALDKEQT